MEIIISMGDGTELCRFAKTEDLASAFVDACIKLKDARDLAQQQKLALDEWYVKTDWMREAPYPLTKWLGKHLADTLSELAQEALKQGAEPAAKAIGILDLIIKEVPKTIGEIKLDLLVEDIKAARSALARLAPASAEPCDRQCSEYQNAECAGDPGKPCCMEAPASAEKDAAYKPWAAVHLKTGNEYTVIGDAIDATSTRQGQGMAIYQRDGKTFVREIGEFMEKFAVKRGENAEKGI